MGAILSRAVTAAAAFSIWPAAVYRSISSRPVFPCMCASVNFGNTCFQVLLLPCASTLFGSSSATAFSSGMARSGCSCRYASLPHVIGNLPLRGFRVLRKGAANGQQDKPDQGARSLASNFCGHGNHHHTGLPGAGGKNAERTAIDCRPFGRGKLVARTIFDHRAAWFCRQPLCS